MRERSVPEESRFIPSREGTRDRRRDEPGDSARRHVHAVVIAAVHGAKPEADREGQNEPNECALKSQRANGGNTGRRHVRRWKALSRDDADASTRSTRSRMGPAGAIELKLGGVVPIRST